jgi:LPS-assembly protein
LSAGFLANDKGGNHDYLPDTGSDLYPQQGEDRYMVRLQHQGNFATSWSSSIDFNEVSDKNYLSDIGQMVEREDNQTHLRRIGSLGYKTDVWHFAVESQDYQSITVDLDDPYRIASRMTLNGNLRYANAVTFDLHHQQTEFRHNSQDFISGGRTALNYRLGIDNRWPWGYFKPTIGVKYLAYQLDTPIEQSERTSRTNNPMITVPTISLDSGIVFEKDSHLFSGYRQTLEPRLFYVKSKYRNQQFLPDFDTKEITASYGQLFSPNRFAGGDRISDDHRLSLGLSTSLFNKENGREKLRASVAQAIYFDDRRVSLTEALSSNSDLERKKSDLALELYYRINNHWRLNNEVVYNRQKNQWGKGSASLYYQNNEKLFNISYQYSHLNIELPTNAATQPIEQIDVSFYVPAGNDISWVGRWHHDFTNDRELEVFSGFEYNNCCWRAGLVFRRWLDRRNDSTSTAQELKLRNGVFLQIQFKGVVGTGGRVASILKKGIYGYEPVENF